MRGVHIDSVGCGPPLVLLHGWAMHSGLFAPLLPRLAEKYRVHRVDLPGQGYSPAVVPYALTTITAAVADAVSSLPDAAAGPMTVLGWSLGGAVAMHWARAEPERVGRLILTAATPCFVARPDWPHAMTVATLRHFGDELAVSHRLALQRFVALQVQGSEHARVVLGQLRKELFARGEPSGVALRDALELLASTDLRADVGAIRQPTVVISGGRDTLTPPGAGEWLCRTLPHASFRLIPAAAHAPFLSHPEAFLAAMADGA
ncbi:MAG: pimeloyl-ACP methyl ester esterase BioH [Pseudomonadota bacterium]|nr:pimeloyl-ACP methyl ester esterase BioH [Pseudomonadota bacterium]